MTRSGREICGQCGVAMPTRSPHCRVCGHGERVIAPPPRFGAFWVGLSVVQECDSCGRPVSVTGAGADGTSCGHCGGESPIGRGAWAGILRFAHDVGDLSGPDPEGEPTRADHPVGDANPYRTVGVTASSVTRRVPARGEAGRLDVLARPGAPLCRRCREPVAWVPKPRPAALTRCSGCGDEQVAGAPDALDHLAVKALATPAAPEPAGDESAATPLKCPVCGASLPAVGTGGLVPCSYCRTASLVPPDPTLGLEAVAPRWWLLFKGCSPLRELLIQGGERDRVGRVLEPAGEGN